VEPDDRIAVVALAEELGVRKQRLFKVLKRSGIQPVLRRDGARGGQRIATITASEAAALREALRSREAGHPTLSDVLYRPGEEVGVFYLVQLEPDHDETRIKVGFTADLEARLRKHRTAAPFATVIKSWPCRRGWERAAIDSITRGYEQLHTEVFRAGSLDEARSRGDAFFGIMPVPRAPDEGPEDSEAEGY